jgi:hypothetical protein
MALFMDGQVSGIEDLTAQDSQLLDVVQVENIDVTEKLVLAQDELAVELDTLLMRLRSNEQPFLHMVTSKIAAVVVTPPLKMWHTFRALEMVYADAYNNQLNDRYAGKRDQFHARAQWACGKVVEAGIGIVADPIPKAATPLVTPLTTTVSGALPDGTYYVTTAWMNRAGEEGASAAPAVVTITSSAFLVQPVNPPANVTGWKVYVGGAPDAMVQQNSLPIAVGDNWTQPNHAIATGRAPGSGQSPNYLRPAPRVTQRG